MWVTGKLCVLTVQSGVGLLPVAARLLRKTEFVKQRQPEQNGKKDNKIHLLALAEQNISVLLVANSSQKE